MKAHITLLLILSLLLSCSRKKPSVADRINYDKGYDYLEASKKDSAFKYLNKAKDDFIQKGYLSYAGNCLVLMGIIQCDAGDYYGAQETALSAIKFLDKKKDSRDLASNYNNLGISCQKLKDYKRAAEIYNQASIYAQDSVERFTLLNNMAVSYVYLRDYDKAINIYNSILSSSNIDKGSIIFAKVYDNLAFAKFQQNPKYNAEYELNKALHIRENIKDTDGLNASFSHLTEYFENRDPIKALFYAKKMFQTAIINKSPDDKLEALQKIIQLEKPENIKTAFKQYQNLKDSLETARNKSKSQFALERYDSEKFKRENVEKDNSILKLLIGVVILIVAIIFIVIGYRRRQLKLKQEKEIEIKNTQLKMSKKVHDVVANGIYQVMTKIENQEDFDRDKALDELEFVYEKSRDISYDKIGEEKEFSKVISELIASFNNETVKTFTAGNSPAIWDPVSATVKEEVYQMIRELMVNMKKHSHASHVAVKFEKINNRVDIQYKDNGIGISGDLIYKNGLRNTASRIETINGTITFETKIEKGLKVNLSFPAS
ncbi:tetratricopeptide repeat-containing sensor histidine kinase [Chryseobacterium sp. RU33C]|uniref:tetratricopeptide repeat-containing sensor histidine kinase n=1 Tax=Chryseobacterium sp. RU33C TaxID=1907398 RepID=UPI0009555332|nr:tetratricopeptide repeat-containing sensor histidine kinase [Chryseobacterium sp. RU33C]SIQ34881.1 Tetratricopeptide repeat-containing protein [Chryseobacterium sp. RU33C]